MTKVLTAATIIPAELYVHRDADRQLRRVLSDMGRPGYILVARQMGKTNLLLNAKRELSNDNDAYPYIDLSNQFGSARDCFQNIINTAVDTHPILTSVKQRIARIREEALAPHKEHEKELRAILSLITGKLVIILDEIDALTAAPFADQIFAQIRSVYFSRINVPEFARLTYILSGVAEPSELIKNTKLSPFNIGEKIYLDDFDRAEFDQFIARAKLDVDTASVDRIFDWTSGNPRMTWDTCAEVEERRERGAVTPADIDDIVKNLYLTTFDRPPVDHIRALAEANPDIRNALVEIRYNKGATLSDAIRTRLYLSGITSSNRADVRIKNRIIDRALSQHWIDDVERQKVGLLKMANERNLLARYQEAIDLYREYLNTGTLGEDERWLAIDGMTAAYVSLGDYTAARDWIRQGRWDRTRFPDAYYSQLLQEGLCCFQLEDYDNAVRCFGELYESTAANVVRAKAALNLGSAHYQKGGANSREQAMQLFEEALQLARGPGVPVPDRNSVEVIVRFNLAQCHQDAGSISAATEQLSMALGNATPSEVCVLQHELADIIPGAGERAALLEECVNTMIAHSVRPLRRAAIAQLSLTPKRFVLLIADVINFGAPELVERLLKYALAEDTWRDAGSDVSRYDLLMSVAIERGPDDARRIMRHIADTAEALGDEKNVSLCYRVLAYYSRGKSDHSENLNKYISHLTKSSRSLDRVDLALLAGVFQRTIQSRNLAEADDLLSALELHRAPSPAGLFVALDYYAMLVARFANRLSDAVEKARTILANDAALAAAEDWMGKKDVRAVRSAAAEIVFAASPPRLPIRLEAKKYQRNERVRVQYADGRVVTAKYKRVEEDVKDGLCVVVD